MPRPRVQLPSFPSLQRSMVEIFRLGLVHNRSLFCTSYMKFKNLTDFEQVNISFLFHSIINKKSPFHWEGLNVTQESNFWFYQSALPGSYWKCSFLNALSNPLLAVQMVLNHKLSIRHKTGQFWHSTLWKWRENSLCSYFKITWTKFT